MRELYNFVRVAKGAGKNFCTRHKGGGRKIFGRVTKGGTFGRFTKGAGEKFWTRRKGGGRKILYASRSGAKYFGRAKMLS